MEEKEFKAQFNKKVAVKGTVLIALNDTTLIRADSYKKLFTHKYILYRTGMAIAWVHLQNVKFVLYDNDEM